MPISLYLSFGSDTHVSHASESASSSGLECPIEPNPKKLCSVENCLWTSCFCNFKMATASNQILDLC